MLPHLLHHCQVAVLPRLEVGQAVGRRPAVAGTLVHQPLARSAPCTADGEEEEDEDEEEEEAEESSCEEEDSSDEDGSVELVGCFLCLGCCPAWLGKWPIEGCWWKWCVWSWWADASQSWALIHCRCSCLEALNVLLLCGPSARCSGQP